MTGRIAAMDRRWPFIAFQAPVVATLAVSAAVGLPHAPMTDFDPVAAPDPKYQALPAEFGSGTIGVKTAPSRYSGGAIDPSNYVAGPPFP